MKFVGRMVTKLLINNGFIDTEDKAEIQDEFDNALKEWKESTNLSQRIIYQFSVSPIGIFAWLGLFIITARYVRKEASLAESESVQEEFEREMETAMMRKMLDKVKHN